jgi:hypothetical protein
LFPNTHWDWTSLLQPLCAPSDSPSAVTGDEGPGLAYSENMATSQMRRLFVGTVLVIVAVAAAVTWVAWDSSSSRPGPLRGPFASATGIPVKALTDVATIGDAALRNTGQTAITIRSITPVSPSPGVHVKVGLAPFGPHSTGAIQGVPTGLVIHPVAGYRIAAHAPVGTELVVVLKIIAGKPGLYRVGGFTVHYDAARSHYSMFVAESMSICYPFAAWAGKCAPPPP